MTVPHDRWKNVIFGPVLHRDGTDPPCVIDWPMNGEQFLASVELFLASTLSPGDISAMDNLPAYKFKGVAETITAQGTKLRYVLP
jgi:hypothetical protein